MIQRIQTVWWVLSIVCLGLLKFVDLITVPEASNVSFISATDVSYLIGPIIGCVVITVIAILLFKRRPLQITLGYISILNHLAIGFGVFIKYKTLLTDYPESQLLPWSGLLLLSIIFQILAIRAVKKDEALIKSMDRLR